MEDENRARVIEPTADDIKKALRLCSVSEPCGSYPCENCYLFGLRDEEGNMSTGRPCFEHLAQDAVALIDRLNDFEHSQSAKLLERIAELQAELTASQRREAAAEDLYKACKFSPCNTGICVKKNCAGNIIPCEFEWRGPQQAGKGDAG